MAQVIRSKAKYQAQRDAKSPPHVPIKYLRLAANLTIDTVIERINEQTNRRYTRGAISAIENGHRCASPQFLEALELALDLPLGSITTDYVPQPPRVKKLATDEQVSA